MSLQQKPKSSKTDWINFHGFRSLGLRAFTPLSPLPFAPNGKTKLDLSFVRAIPQSGIKGKHVHHITRSMRLRLFTKVSAHIHWLYRTSCDIIQPVNIAYCETLYEIHDFLLGLSPQLLKRIRFCFSFL